MPHEINYDLLPSHIRSGVKDYIENGHIPGDFLTAVISNDLSESFGRADETNREWLFDIVNFFYNEAPFDCWKSVTKMQAWAAHRGLAGIDVEVQ